MRKAIAVMIAFGALGATAADAGHTPIPGRYEGSEHGGGYAIRFGVIHHNGGLIVINFTTTRNGHGNVDFSEAKIHNGYFRRFTPEGEIDISGDFVGPGTVAGDFFVQGGHSFHWTAHHRNEVP